jgi:hypothetical protein
MIEMRFTFTIANKSSLGQDQPMDVSFSTLKKPEAGQSRVTVFAVVRNEMYFLPHFLRHYRDLGVREFWFLDDRSTDGTREFLLAQPDCGTIEANLAFGDRVAHTRFGVAAKTLVPRAALLQNRWVLMVDADEFLSLPQAFASIDVLVAALERAGLKVARAAMLDFFRIHCACSPDASPDSNPFALCPNFDAWQTMDWPDGAREPTGMCLWATASGHACLPGCSKQQLKSDVVAVVLVCVDVQVSAVVLGNRHRDVLTTPLYCIAV